MTQSALMGIGMVVVVPLEERDNALSRLRQQGKSPRLIGRIVAEECGVELV